MEALAAIGLVSNVVQFIELGYKALSASKEMYGAGNEASRSNKDLAFVCEEMKRLSLGLDRKTPASEMTEDEKAMRRLAAECGRWSEELLAFLEGLKNKSPNSRVKAFKAVLRNIRKQNERVRLERGLDACRRQLDLQLTSMSRSELLEKLNDLSHSVTASRGEISALRRTVKDATSISPESLGKLGDILQISDQALLRSKKNRFLEALRYGGMQDRFLDVADPHEKTFEWLLEDTNTTRKSDTSLNYNNVSSDPCTEASGANVESLTNHSPHTVVFRREARERFTSWLKRDRGIFHISGKPGAGKSTMMKFLCKSPMTRRYLEEWSNGKKVVFAKSFFWRLGNNMQKSLNGLIRSLLYQVLSTAPHLIPLTFPSLWKQIAATPGVQIEFEELNSAFKNLTSNRETFEQHKMVFFIDGLDEYEGRHIDIVRQFFDWTAAHPDDVKICVASREWSEFLVGFAECPKLRIHECTHEDIIQFVTDRLDKYDHYLTLASKEDITLLAQEIVHKAEGVFLWVKLVLTSVEDGLLDGDSALDLRSKVAAFPNELEQLYQYLFDSIHVTNRRKAFEALRMTRHMRLDHGLPLLRYWFLNEVIADQDFAIKMSLLNSSDEDTTQLLRTTRRQLYGRCKGFLEVYPPRVQGSKIKYLPDDGEVRYMHSTVHEFLERDDIKQAIDKFVGCVDFFDRICQTFLATVKFSYQEEYYTMPDDADEYEDTAFNQDLAAILNFAVEDVRIFPHSGRIPEQQHRFLTFLDGLETAAIPRQASKGASKYKCLCRDLVHGNALWICEIQSYAHPSTHIQDFAISCLMHEFLRRKHAKVLIELASEKRPIAGNRKATDFVVLLMARVGPPKYTDVPRPMKSVDYIRLYEMLKFCFATAISPNYMTNEFGIISLFEGIICIFLFDQTLTLRYGGTNNTSNKRQIYPVRLFKLCLFYGAKSDLKLIFGPVYKRKFDGLVAVQVQASKSVEWVSINNRMLFPRELPIIDFAKKHDWVVTLRDLVEFWFPDDHKVFQYLIDRNDSCSIKSDREALQRTEQPIWQDDDNRNWAEVEIGDRIFPDPILIRDQELEKIFDRVHS